MKKELAIIGYGRFGRCAAHHLKKRFRVVVADVRKITNVEKGIFDDTIEAAATKPIVIMAVPIHQTATLLRKIAPLLAPKTLVCDVCSVKEQPLQWMKKLLPAGVYILGTHPLFGPDSAAESLRGRAIALCPVRIPRAKMKRVRSLFFSMGLHIVTMTATEHDRLMAGTLFLTQFVGRGLLRMKLPRTRVSTQHFQFLQRLVEVTQNDTHELFCDMHRYNRFAHSVPQDLVAAFQKTHRSLRLKP